MFTVCKPLPQMIQDQAFRSVSPPKDVISTLTPIFSFTDPRHSPAFVQRMRNARPDPSQFKIKLFKVQMDIPGVEEALNPVNPLGHMKRIGLSMAAMSFLSPNKCKIEENQTKRSEKDQDSDGMQHEAHEDQLAFQEINSAINGGTDQVHNNSIQATVPHEIPLLPVHVLSQAKWGQSQSPQHNEDFYSPSEYRKKIHDNLLRDESMRQDDLACTQNTQDQRSSMFSQTDQRNSLLTSSEQRTSQQSQSQQRTSLLSQNNQSKTAASSEQPDERPTEQSEDSETFKEREERHSSLRIEQENDSKSWNTAEVDQFNTKQVFPKIVKEHYGSMLLPSEGNDAFFKEEEEEEVDQNYNMSFSKKWVSKHKKHNNYSIDTPSFKHISHTTYTLPSFSFSESISGGKEYNFVSQNRTTLIGNITKESEGYTTNNNNNLLSSYLNYGQQKVKQPDIVDKIAIYAFHRKNDAVNSNFNVDNQESNSNYDNKYPIYNKYDSLTKPSEVINPVLKEQQISIVQVQPSYFPNNTPPSNNQILEVNTAQISPDFNKVSDKNTSTETQYGNNVIHKDMPFERIEQIIEDSLKRTSALIEQIKEDKIKQGFNKVDIKPKENVTQGGQLQSQISPKLDIGNHSFLNGTSNAVKNIHSLSNPLFKPVHQAYLGELSQKHQNTHIRYESNSSYNLNSYQQNPLHVEQLFSAPTGLDPSQIIDSGSNPYVHRIPDSKQVTNEAQIYPKTNNNTTISSSSSNWRNYSHLSSSVDYSMVRQMPSYVPPAQSLAVNSSYSSSNPQQLQTQGQDSQISQKYQLLNNEKQPSGSSLSLKMHSHSLSPAPMQYLSSNQRQIPEETTETFKNNPFQPSFQDSSRFLLNQKNEGKVIPLPSLSNKTIPSATVNLLSKKYSISQSPLIGNIKP